ncbi:MAG: hypothetical protein AAF600_02990 [Bacteroidota bacterium]
MEEEEIDNRLFEKYKLVISARNFHYENFNKWLTYFYVANAAIFVGFIQIATVDSEKISFDKDFASIATLSLGWLAGILLYWSSKGYYYWNINFIMLVNHYEKDLMKWNENERIYSMFANKEEQNNFFSPFSGANFSTSKIAILFAYIIVTSWGALLLNILLSQPSSTGIYIYSWLIPIVSIFGSGVFVIGATWLFGIGKKHFLWSNTDPLIDLKISQ